MSEGGSNSVDASLKKRERDLDLREESLRKKEKKLEEHTGRDEDLLQLSVGGKSMSVMRRTLTQVEGSFLATMFSGSWDGSLTKENGKYFLDQDYDTFEVLVSFLRHVYNYRYSDNAEFPSTPSFKTEEQMKKFSTMVDFFGLTLLVFQIGCYHLDFDSTQILVAASPGIEISTEEKNLYWLTPSNSHSRQVKSFEVKMGPHSFVQVGWADVADDPRGLFLSKELGYTMDTGAFDSAKKGMVRNGRIISVPGVSVEEGTTIRSENRGAVWYFDGEAKVTTKESHLPNTVVIEQVGNNFAMAMDGTPAPGNIDFLRPCITLKGSCRITYIELDP